MGYDSPLRWWRSNCFLAEKGMGITVRGGLEMKEQLRLLAPGSETPRFITVERRWERNDGSGLAAIVAHTGDPDHPIVRWENPVLQEAPGTTPQWHDDEIGVASCLMSLSANADASQLWRWAGRLDQAFVLALRQSAEEGGQPVILQSAE